jgi:DNA-binding HxlR family transcriptional regulator
VGWVRNLDSPYSSQYEKSTHCRMIGFMAAVMTKPRTCSVARTLEIVGEKWALLAIREVFLGSRRFDETMAARLRTLVAHDILVRRRYNEHPPRDEYVLTESGRDLYPVILSLMQWGDRHRPLDTGPPLTLEHSCGHRLEHRWDCIHCGQEIHAREVARVQ